MAVMKDRLSRGFQVRIFASKDSFILIYFFQVYDPNDTSSSKFDQFKRCFRERAKYDAFIAPS
jgi:hypothetical protein